MARWTGTSPKDRRLVDPAADAVLSAFAPAGVEAAVVLRLFWVMFAGAVLVWLGVLAIAWQAMRRREPVDARRAHGLILAGGVAVPTIVLGALLAWGLTLMPRLRAAVPADALHVAVSGEQWWWRVHYRDAGVDTANEIRIPVGRPVALALTSPDVIHSFWVPALAGKVDMVPGRSNTLVLQADRPGTYRGVCAEFCGASHADMRFLVVAMPSSDFERWLGAQSRPAAPPDGSLGTQGQAAFLRNGCGACHAVRGTTARGRVGPDLTHVGGRLELAAGALPNDAAALRHWIERPHATKPEALMPGFAMLPPTEVRAIAAWLGGLR
jgi:cytochrome c oxidase subunit 2